MPRPTNFDRAAWERAADSAREWLAKTLRALRTATDPFAPRVTETGGISD